MRCCSNSAAQEHAHICMQRLPARVLLELEQRMRLYS